MYYVIKNESTNKYVSTKTSYNSISFGDRPYVFLTLNEAKAEADKAADKAKTDISWKTEALKRCTTELKKQEAKLRKARRDLDDANAISNKKFIRETLSQVKYYEGWVKDAKKEVGGAKATLTKATKHLDTLKITIIPIKFI